MIADEQYGYLTENHVDLFAEKSDFDGKHGIMATNRTLQRPGKAHQIRPMEEWIVSVGKHPGVISWRAMDPVQSMLEVNKSKSYRRPRSNVALLSGLLVCGDCGDYMRPKLTNRHAANGELIYTYMCSTKERSQELPLPDEKCQRQHTGRKGDLRNQKTVRRQELLCRLPGSDEEGHQRQSGGIRRRVADPERKAG